LEISVGKERSSGQRAPGGRTGRGKRGAQIFYHSGELIVRQAGPVADHLRNDIPPFIGRVALRHDDIEGMTCGACSLNDVATFACWKFLGQGDASGEYATG